MNCSGVKLIEYSRPTMMAISIETFTIIGYFMLCMTEIGKRLRKHDHWYQFHFITVNIPRGENKEIYGHLSLINNVLLKMYGEKKWPEIFQEADDFLKKMNEFTPYVYCKKLFNRHWKRYLSCFEIFSKADSIDGVSQLKSLLEKLREPQEEHLPAPQIKQPLSKKHASLFKIKQRICIIWGMVIYQIDLMKKDQR